MSSGRPWKPGHPLFCPECGEPTACRTPGDSRFGGIGVTLAFLGFVLVISRGRLPPAALAFGILGILVPCIVVALWLRMKGLLPVSRDGFVLCLQCGWMRVGALNGTRLGRLRNRAVAWSRRIVFALLPAVLFFGTIGVLWDRPDALLIACALVLPLGIGIDLLVAHRPREWPPPVSPRDEDDR